MDSQIKNIKVLENKKCTGCTACVSICPKNAIKMCENYDGFKYPKIEESKCINCGLCAKICPVLNTKNNTSLNECYAAYNKDKKEIKSSSSGGVFSILANYTLDNNGIVIGAAFNEENKLYHVAITKKKELNKLKGSKYLQSDLDNIFTYIKYNIKDKLILFVGTPCQIAGLKSIIKNSDNLICIDIVCHGVPSPKLFEKYIKELENINNDKLINYNFRDKVSGWENYSNTISFKSKKFTELHSKNKYMSLFLSDIALRDSCYNCNFKLGNKYSDITLGDFWGVKKYYPYMYNQEGVSVVIINTIKGREIFNIIKNNMEFKKCKIEEITSGNPSLKFSAVRPINKEKFFKELDNKSVEYLTKKYKKKFPLYRKIINKLKNILKIN